MKYLIKCVFALLLLAALAACQQKTDDTAQAGSRETGQSPTNVLLICIDTVSFQSFFSDRIEDGLTPWLASAQVYREANSTAPWTIPSVASILTGLYPVQHHAGAFERRNANLDVDLPSALPAEAETMAEILAGEGFRTAAFSAHPWFEADFGFDQGFAQMHLRKGWPNVTALFWQWLHERAGQAPYFGYLHFMEAHDWHTKPKNVLQERLQTLDPHLRETLLADSIPAACTDTDADICLRNMVYNLAVREQRTAIASVLEGLAERERMQDTLVIVYADHGEEFWQHKAEHRQHGDPRGVYGFGHGHSLYQELLHVPLLAWYPNVAGQAHDEVVSLVDVLPSVLDWLAIDRSARELPGRTLPLGTATVNGANQDRALFASGIAYGTEAIASRENAAKSILYLKDQSFEHFDLAQDPGEKHPLTDDSRTMRADVLSGDYLDLASESQAQRPELGAEQLEKLKSIGYLQGVDETQDSADGKKPEADEKEDP